MIVEISERYLKLKNRVINPDGTFDNAGRWYPNEQLECCKGIRSPSRAFPYGLLTHCRSAEHVGQEFGVSAEFVKRCAHLSKKLSSDLEVIAQDLYVAIRCRERLAGKSLTTGQVMTIAKKLLKLKREEEIQCQKQEQKMNSSASSTVENCI